MEEALTGQPVRYYECRKCHYFFTHVQLEEHAAALGQACMAAVLFQFPGKGPYNIGGTISLFDDDRAYCPNCVRCPVDIGKYDRTVPRRHFGEGVPARRRWPVKRTKPWVSIAVGLGAFILVIAVLLLAATGFFRAGGK